MYMKLSAVFFAMFMVLSLNGASMNWTVLLPDGYGVEMDANGTISSQIEGGVRGSDGASALVLGMFFTHGDSSGTRLKAYDYSKTAAPVNTKWLLAVYGDILGEDTLSSFKGVELCDYGDCGVGGDLIENPSSFYLAFVAEDWDDYVSKVDNPHVWYGWANVAIKSNGALDVLSSGVNLDGGAVVIGGGVPIPEPSTGMLLLVGLAFAGLSRRNDGRM